MTHSPLSRSRVVDIRMCASVCAAMCVSCAPSNALAQPELQPISQPNPQPSLQPDPTVDPQLDPNIDPRLDPELPPPPPRPEQTADQTPSPIDAGPTELELRVRSAVQTHASELVHTDLDALLAHFATTSENATQNGALPIVSWAFAHPLELEALETDMFGRVANAATNGTLDVCAPLISHGLGIFQETNAVYARAQAVVDDPEAAAALDEEIFAFWVELNERRTNESQHALDFALFLRDATEPTEADTERFGALLSDGFVKEGLPKMLGPDFLRLGEMADQLLNIANTTDPIAAPEDVREAVPEGLIHFAQLTPDGWIIVGSVLNNTYSMDKILVVFDTGGDDVYSYNAVMSAQLTAVFDIAGNDTHTGTVDGAGPATAVFGTSILIDFKGDDTYTSSGSVSIGAGLFGAGLLIDHEGNDTYSMTGKNAAWGIGAGIHGCGMVIDRDGDDTYLSKGLAVGVGGRAGFGAVIDLMGKDTHTAHTQTGTGQPNYPLALMGHGAGAGVPEFASAGLGMFYDLSGTDTYDVPSMGIANAAGMGIAHDESGADTHTVRTLPTMYAGARESSIAMYIDNDGDDTYTGMIAAADVNSISLLIDRTGNDTYIGAAPRTDMDHGFSAPIASAGNASLAMLIDTAGDDSYSTQNSLLGMSSNDTFDEEESSPARSFSLLLDLAGADTFTLDGVNLFAHVAHKATKAVFTQLAKPVRNDDGTLTGGAHGLIVDGVPVAVPDIPVKEPAEKPPVEPSDDR